MTIPFSLPAPLILWPVLCLFAFPAFGQSREVSEYQLKAAFLHRFASFVEWPDAADTDSAFTIGVLGDDSFGETLQLIDSQTVAGQPIEIRRFSKLEDLEPTRILFVSRSESNRLAQVFAAVGDRATLTVGETTSFTSQGGIIRFVARDRQLRLEVNRCAADRAGLRISALLLRVADLTPEACEITGR